MVELREEKRQKQHMTIITYMIDYLMYYFHALLIRILSNS